jgi:hypothetical protein
MKSLKTRPQCIKNIFVICFLSILLLPSYLLGQQAEDVEQGIFKINFLPISASYEMRVGQYQTMMLEPGAGFEYSYSSDNTYWNFSPNLGIHYRYYYNFDARNEKGRRTAKNSVNFVGAYSRINIYTNYADFGENSEGYKFMTFGPVWGIQRNYKSHFSLGLMLGPAISFYPGKIAPDMILQLTLGFHIGK